MSTFTHESMINNHIPELFSRVSDTLRLWRHRYQARRELAQWTDRDRRDAGVSWSDIVYEADKPFWRA
jgi:uncharacterized protein YjiS (DUF1127 family)